MSASAPSVLAVIPARGGSKGLPRKNVRKFLGRPLLAWTIEVARQSEVFARIVVSSEDPEIVDVGRRWGADAPFLRPRELAEDDTPTAPVIKHVVEWCVTAERWVPDLVVVLEPTAPARQPFHIRQAIDLLLRSGADSVASISVLPHHYNPVKVLRMDADGAITGMDGTHVRDMIHRRQDLSVYYAFNGLLFVTRTDVIRREPPTLWGDRVLGYVVDRKYDVDIDTADDWAVAEAKVRAILGQETGA